MGIPHLTAAPPSPHKHPMAGPQSPHSTLREPHGNPKSIPRPYHGCPAPPTTTPPSYSGRPTPYGHPLVAPQWLHSHLPVQASPLSPDSRWAPRWGCCHRKGSHGARRGAPTEWYQWGHASSRCPRCPAPAATRGAGPHVLPRHTATATLQGMGGVRGGQPQPHTQPHTAPCAQGRGDAPGGLHRNTGTKKGPWNQQGLGTQNSAQGAGGPGGQERHPGGWEWAHSQGLGEMWG